MMTKDDIVTRVNQLMHEELYVYDDMKYDLDDAIIEINNALNAKFPSMTSVFTEDRETYTYDIPDDPETEEDETETNVPIFPEQYIKSVVIPFTIRALFARQLEYGPEYQQAHNNFNNGLTMMFRDYFHKVPDTFKDLDGGYFEFDVSTYTDED